MPPTDSAVRAPLRLALGLGLVLVPLAGTAAPTDDDNRPAIFRITPLRPVAELRAQALAASPPVEAGPFRPVELVELTGLDPTIQLDIRYATTENFLSTPVYPEARALLQREAAIALVRAHRALHAQGFGLLIHDAYRPWWVTKLFWDATPADKRDFVADPAKGSRHNRGCAVDLTLYRLLDGRAVEMPSLYDEMTERAAPGFAGGPADARRLRDLLRAAMEREAFTVFESEWWHFDYSTWREYPILNLPFESFRRVSSHALESRPPW